MSRGFIGVSLLVCGVQCWAGLGLLRLCAYRGLPPLPPHLRKAVRVIVTIAIPSPEGDASTSATVVAAGPEGLAQSTDDVVIVVVPEPVAEPMPEPQSEGVPEGINRRFGVRGRDRARLLLPSEDFKQRNTPD